MFCLDKFCFLLQIGDMLEQNVFGNPDLDSLVDNITPPISNGIETFLNSISIYTQLNDVPTGIHGITPPRPNFIKA